MSAFRATANKIDKEYGGLYGRIENDNTVIPQASKGDVLNSRILWSFPAAFNLTNFKDYLITAERSFDSDGGLWYEYDIEKDNLIKTTVGCRQKRWLNFLVHCS